MTRSDNDLLFAGHLRALLLLVLVVLLRPAGAYPEYQKFSQQRSGRSVDCAMCHLDADGPYGTKPGQVGGLSASELEVLTKARNANAAKTRVQSPILNAFGNEILDELGGQRIRELVKDFLEIEHITCDGAGNLKEALALLVQKDYHLILLD